MRLITARRAESIAGKLSGMGLDAALFLNSEPVMDSNVQYLTGFGGMLTGAALLTKEGTKLITTELDYGRAVAEAESTEVIKSGRKKGFYATVAEHCSRYRKIGIVKSKFTIEMSERLKLDAGSLKDVGSFMEAERSVKDPKELDALRRCARIANKGVKLIEGLLNPRLTEAELAAELDHELRKHGSERPAFETIVTSGKRSYSIHPHPGASKKKLEPGLGIIDFGATLNGYSSDVTVPFCIGSPTQAQKRLMECVMTTWDSIKPMLREGCDATELHKVYEKETSRRGLSLMHSLGHGIGLDVHENPALSGPEKTLLKSGMAVAIEPGAYDSKAGGCRLENDVIVTKKGFEMLTESKLISI